LSGLTLPGSPVCGAPDPGTASVLVADSWVRYLNVCGPLVPAGVVTFTFTAPAAWAGVTNDSEVALLTFTNAAGTTTAPIVTDVLPGTKRLPVTVTLVPPPVGPDAGVRPVVVGAVLDDVVLDDEVVVLDDVEVVLDGDVEVVLVGDVEVVLVGDVEVVLVGDVEVVLVGDVEVVLVGDVEVVLVGDVEVVLVLVVEATEQFGRVMVLLSRVTAPFRASSRPATVAPVLAVIDVRAKMVPTNTEFVPRVAELPTWKKTLHGSAPLMSTMRLADAVIRVLADWKMNTALGLPCASSVSVPVRESVVPVYTPATSVWPPRSAVTVAVGARPAASL